MRHRGGAGHVTPPYVKDPFRKSPEISRTFIIIKVGLTPLTPSGNLYPTPPPYSKAEWEPDFFLTPISLTLPPYSPAPLSSVRYCV